MPSSPAGSKLGLIEALKPYGLRRWTCSAPMLTSVGTTISGANGSDAATAHGATVPSSGPNGTPRAT